MPWNLWRKFWHRYCCGKTHNFLLPAHDNAMGKKFFVYGITGCMLEILWTGFCSFLAGDLALTGKTYLWMFPIYGMAVLAEPAFVYLSRRPFFLRCLAYPVGIFAAEYTTGWLLRALVGVCPWDYSGHFFTIHGLIRLDYAPLWILLGSAFETVCLWMKGGWDEVFAKELQSVPFWCKMGQNQNRMEKKPWKD